jgi:hypothetical protein
MERAERRQLWVAHASRVRVTASRRDELAEALRSLHVRYAKHAEKSSFRQTPKLARETHARPGARTPALSLTRLHP